MKEQKIEEILSALSFDNSMDSLKEKLSGIVPDGMLNSIPDEFLSNPKYYLHQ